MNRKNYEAVLAKTKGTMHLCDHRGHVRFNLQIHADEDTGESSGGDGESGSGEDGAGDHEDGESSGGNDHNKRMYDDAEVDRIVAKHRKEWEAQAAKDLEEARDEARKYERMSKEQREQADKKKAEEEAAKKDARIKELEQKIATDALRKSVAADVEAMPEDIKVSQDFLDLAVTGDADTSNANVKKLVGIILADRKAQEEKRATGRTPRGYSHNGNGDMTEIDRRIAKYNGK